MIAFILILWASTPAGQLALVNAGNFASLESCHAAGDLWTQNASWIESTAGYNCIARRP